jgi:Kdo2-lipid IVA lauroyltransferase/acyltransferase
MRNPVVEWINHRSRTRYSGDIFTRDQGLRPAIRQIRRGRFFYYLPDEDLGAEGAVFVDFFGVPKATLTALGRLARMTGAAVLPSFAWYDAASDQYLLKLWPPMEGFPSGDDTADARAMNAAIERAIREAPAQYLWTMRLFRTRPDGQPHPYRYPPGNRATGTGG